MKRLFLLVPVGLLVASLLLTPHSFAKAEEPKEKTMTIRWYGQSFFQVQTSSGRKFAFDPHAITAFGRQTTKADFVIVSHSHDDHSLIQMIDTGKMDEKTKEPVTIAESDVLRGVVLKGTKQEWKTIDEKRGNIRIRNVATYHDTNNGLQRGKNSIFLVEADGLVICHLGDLGHKLTDEQVKAIGKVDVLMVPVGGIYTINGEQAAAVAEQLKPRLFVLPMHYGVPEYDDLAGPEEFLEGFKKEDVKKMLNTNELTFPIDIKPEKPTVVLLGWKKEEAAPPPKNPKDPKKP